MILCGDSMGMIVYGWPGTVPVTMDMSIAHCQAVRRGAPNTYLIGDMPFAPITQVVRTPCATRCAFIRKRTWTP